MTLPECKDDVEDNHGIAHVPPVASHSELLHMPLSTKLQWLEAQNDCDPICLQLVHKQLTAERGDEATYKTYAVPRNKLLLLTDGATRHAHGYRSFNIHMNNQIFMNKLDYHNLDFLNPRLTECSVFVTYTASSVIEIYCTSAHVCVYLCDNYCYL